MNRQYRGDSQVTLKSRASSLPEKHPTPLDFTAFVPWACLQYQLPYSVKMIPAFQIDTAYPEPKPEKPTSATSLKTSATFRKNGEIYSRITQSIDEPVPPELAETLIIIRAFYDSRGHLVSVSVENSVPLPRKLLCILNICTPFHPSLTKLTLRNGLSNSLLSVDVTNFLAHSNLTDICLDGSCIAGGGYYVLLETPSHLKCLYLSRCELGDLDCKEIATRLVFGTHHSKTLSVLDLSSNLITDVGAKALGHMLRSNRQLAHLNLLGNKLTDEGALHILDVLVEFPLTPEEKEEVKGEKMAYFSKRLVIYDNILAELKSTDSVTKLHEKKNRRTTSNSIRMVVNKDLNKRKESNHAAEAEVINYEAQANEQTEAIVGVFSHPFNSANSEVAADGYTHCSGNFTLCYLNLGYNDLAFPTALKLKSVLRYQYEFVKGAGPGLLRVVLAGNAIPEESYEMMWIEMMLADIIKQYLPSQKSKKGLRVSRDKSMNKSKGIKNQKKIVTEGAKKMVELK